MQHIEWKDEALVGALSALHSLPGGREAAERVGIEYLVASCLAANDFNAEVSLQPLLQAAEWRESSGAAAVRAELLAAGPTGLEQTGLYSACPHFETVCKHLPLCEGGKAVDKRGMSYAIRCMGMADIKNLFSVLSEDQLFQWQIFVNEWRLLQLEAYAARTGRLVNIMIIQDLHSPQGLLSLWRRNHEKSHIMRKVTSVLDSYYPGLVGSVLLTNAPWALHAILQVIRPLLPARIASRIEVLPPKLTAPRLQELIDPVNFPAFLGGEGNDDEFVPTRPSAEAAGAGIGSSLIVKAGRTEEQSIFLEKGDIAGYGFNVSNAAAASSQDILFSCRFRPDAAPESAEEVRAATRVVEDSGGSSYKAPSRGHFVLVFDNSYSWINAKSIQVELVRLSADSATASQDTLASQEGKSEDNVKKFGESSAVAELKVDEKVAEKAEEKADEKAVEKVGEEAKD